MDRTFIRSTAVIGGANIGARALGILFSFVIAKYYTASQFGDVRYLIALSSVFLIPAGGLPRTLSRFVTRHYGNSDNDADTYFTNSIVLIGLVTVLVLAAAMTLTLSQRQINPGFLALCFGLSVFNVYLEVLRSVQRFASMALFYISSNVVQLVVVLVGVLVHFYSVTLAVAAYGLASLIPLAVIELTQRSQLRLRTTAISFARLRELANFSVPVVLAHTAYTAWFSGDLILVTHFLGLAASANYALSKTATLVFIFVPYATTTVVLPRFVHAESRHGTVYLKASLLASAASSATLLVALAVGGNAALYLAFHHKYSTVSLTLFPISLGMAMYSIYLVLETWVVSIGRPTLHALSMSLIAAMTLGGDLVLIPMYGQVGAGAAFLIGMTAGLLTLSVAAWATRPARRAQAAVHSPHVA